MTTNVHPHLHTGSLFSVIYDSYSHALRRAAFSAFFLALYAFQSMLLFSSFLRFFCA